MTRTEINTLAALSCVLTTSCVDSSKAPQTEGYSGDVQWVQLEGGCFAFGETRIYREEGPVHDVCVSPFEISAHEITHGQFAAFIEATGYLTRAERGWREDEEGAPGAAFAPGSAVFSPPKNPDPRQLNWWRLVEGASWRTPAGPEGGETPDNSHPVRHVTREDAEAFAQWLGARLPTEEEWEYAARGGFEGELLAWADAEEADLTRRANTWQGIFPVVNSEADGFKGIAPVGSYPPNGFGLYDMIGNVWEWTSSPYTPDHSDEARRQAGTGGLDPSQPSVPVGTIKGGSFLCARSYCYRYRPAARQSADLALSTSHIGFRIVRDVKADRAG